MQFGIQVERLQKLQAENQQAADKLKRSVEEGGTQLVHVQLLVLNSFFIHFDPQMNF